MHPGLYRLGVDSLRAGQQCCHAKRLRVLPLKISFFFPETCQWLWEIIQSKVRRVNLQIVEDFSGAAPFDCHCPANCGVKLYRKYP